MAPTLERRKGVQVVFRNPADDGWQQGELVHGSSTGEEWLVKNRFGQYWVAVTRLRPAEGSQPGH